MAIIGTIEIPTEGRMLTICGPVLFPETMDLKDLFNEMIGLGYSPNAFRSGLVESIAAQIVEVDATPLHRQNSIKTRERKEWRAILVALQPDEES